MQSFFLCRSGSNEYFFIILELSVKKISWMSYSLSGGWIIFITQLYIIESDINLNLYFTYICKYNHCK